MKVFNPLFLLIGLLNIWTGTAAAHPMGNFSINHYSGLRIREEAIHLRYILDFAEIPAFQEIQQIDTDADGKTSENEIARYLEMKLPQLTEGLELKIAGTPISLQAQTRELEFTNGVAGLPTMRLAVDYRAALPEVIDAKDRNALVYRDNNYPQRTGWKEMSARGSKGVLLIGSTLPSEGSELQVYPDDPLQAPPQIVSTRFAFQFGNASIKQEIPKSDLPNMKRESPTENPLTQLMTGNTPSGRTLIVALALAFGLGAVHALSPGHGKTLVAAYLVGSQGALRHALLLGLCVTFSHTLGVFALGFVTLYLSDVIVPEALYPWLSRLSGLGIFVIGLSVLRKRLAGLGAGHGHAHDHDHIHPHQHGHVHGHGHAPETGASGLRGILALGLSGGILPCPSALMVLLSAVAFHQIGFGLLLIVAFSAGLAATLVGLGLIVVTLGSAFQASGRFTSFVRFLPPLSAAGMACLGLAIALGDIVL